MLFDFETSEQLTSWTLSDARQDRMERAGDYATSGAHSLLIQTPEWKPGMNEWPIWQTTKLPVTDWSGYDRLMIDFTNPSDTAALVRGKAVDSAMQRKSSDQWPGWSQSVPARGHLRAIIPLDSFLNSSIDRKDMVRFLIYTARATPDYRLYLDNVTLLKPGEEPSALPSAYVRRIVDLRLKSKSFGQTRKALNVAQQAVGNVIGNATIHAWAQASFEDLQATMDARVAEANAPQIEIARVAEIGDEIDLIDKRAMRLATLIDARTALAEFNPVTQYAAAWATSMDKVLPRDMPLNMLHVQPVRDLSVARNESESVQVVIIPFDQCLEDVRVEVGALQAEDGAALPMETTDVRVVGFVKTNRPAYDVDYVGWWPDPLLDFLSEVNIEPGDAQPFWVRVRPGKDARPGVYEAPVRITSSNASPTELTLRVRVRSFEVPDAAPIPIATQDPDDRFFNKYSTESWDTLKFKVADFLADYYIDFDNIYRHGPPDFEILRRLKEQGRLKCFSLSTLSYVEFVPDMTEEQYQKAWEKLVSEVDPGYQQAKELGLLEYAYIYGMDEVSPASYPVLKRVTDDVKKRYPEVPIMTTAQDFTYGQASGADSVDAWVPIIHEYKPDLVKEARDRGKKVWWYTCQSPAHPYPNIFTEYPAIEIRLLMGAMTMKYQPDGFLYYCTFRDQGPPRKTVDTGPFTEWDARAFVEPFNGEGYLGYPGKNGRPLASLRLENFRDGLEDYAYWQLLGQIVENTASAGNEAWLAEARSALNVPTAIVKSAHEFTLDTGLLYDYREKLAALIESAP